MSSNPSPEAWRRRFQEILKDLEHPPLGASTALAEECGEVARLLLDHHAYAKPMDPAKLGGELADVFVCLCEIASLHAIDLDQAIGAKAEDLAERAPKWRVELAEALRKARG